jgi:hypothetical protein
VSWIRLPQVASSQVLAKHRKALTLFGINHVRHGINTAVGMYGAHYPHSTYVIADYHGFGDHSACGGWARAAQSTSASNGEPVCAP